MWAQTSVSEADFWNFYHLNWSLPVPKTSERRSRFPLRLCGYVVMWITGGSGSMRGINIQHLDWGIRHMLICVELSGGPGKVE